MNENQQVVPELEDGAIYRLEATGLTYEELVALKDLADENNQTWSKFCQELATRYIEERDGVYF